MDQAVLLALTVISAVLLCVVVLLTMARARQAELNELDRAIAKEREQMDKWERFLRDTRSDTEQLRSKGRT